MLCSSLSLALSLPIVSAARACRKMRHKAVGGGWWSVGCKLWQGAAGWGSDGKTEWRRDVRLREMSVREAVYKQNSKCWRLTDVPDVLSVLRATFVTWLPSINGPRRERDGLTRCEKARESWPSWLLRFWFWFWFCVSRSFNIKFCGWQRSEWKLQHPLTSHSHFHSSSPLFFR